MRRTTTILAAAPLAALVTGLLTPAAQAAPSDADPSVPAVIASAAASSITLDAAQQQAMAALRHAAGASFQGTIGVEQDGAGTRFVVRQPGSVLAQLGSPEALTSRLRVEQAAASSPVPTSVTTAPGTVSELRDIYSAPLTAAIASTPALERAVTGYGVHQARGTFVVRVQDAADQQVIDALRTALPEGFEIQEAPAATEAPTQTLSDRSAEDGNPLDTMTTRALDLGPGGHKAGAQLWLLTSKGAVGTCTIGYGYRWKDEDYMVTAGHCAPKGEGSTMMLAGLNLETDPDSQLDVATKGPQDDIAVAKMAMSDGMYAPGSANEKTVLDDYETGDLAGKEVCHSGARTKGSCGWKVDPAGKMKTAFPIPDASGKVHKVYLDVYASTAPMDAPGDHGDSGGPMYIQQADGRKTLVGSLTGGGTNRKDKVKVLFFTGLDAIEEAMPGGHPITRTTP